MVRSFFKYHREPLQVQGNIKTIETKKRYHAYTRDELVKMTEVGDLEERAVIMLGTQLGIRVNDFVTMKRKSILEAYQNANGEFPLELEIETQKEGVISIGHISKEVYETLQFYWKSLQSNNSEYAFPSNGSYISDQRANDILKNTWLKAYPDRKDAKIRFHELRSFKISALTNLGTNQWVIQKMTGKKVSSDINVYLTGINLKEVFMKAEQVLNLTQVINNNHGAIEELRDKNRALELQLKIITEKVDLWEKDNKMFTEMMNELQYYKDGNYTVIYSDPKLKEQWIAEILERERLRKERV